MLRGPLTTRLADLADPDDVAYLRRTRREMLRALGVTVDGTHDPVPFALYTLALDGERRIGMCEAALLSAVYRNVDDVPYRTLVPDHPFEQLSSIRSIWVEPTDRGSSAFVTLYEQACRVLFEHGARVALFAAAAPALVRLYEAQRARRLGTFHEPASACSLVLLALDLEEVCRRQRPAA